MVGLSAIHSASLAIGPSSHNVSKHQYISALVAQTPAVKLKQHRLAE